MKVRDLHSHLADGRPGFLIIALGMILSLVLSQDSLATEDPTVRLAVIGDYGSGSREEAQVAALVSDWAPDAVITVGDNNYPRGARESIDANIGRYYHKFIGDYSGKYGEGSKENRFFPALGNHDWITSGAEPYFGYFTLPGNERYYDVGFGAVRVFVIDSDPHEPDGNSATSKQAMWLRKRLAATNEPWKIVVCHHPPYSSGMHGPATWMQWPFKDWGATAVIAGHDHDYERIFKHRFPFFVNGFGGAHLRSFQRPATRGSRVRFASDHGAMLIVASSDAITFQAVDRTGRVIDTYDLRLMAEGPTAIPVASERSRKTGG
jgi:tartrate-resistant acid phosphatase type 5